MSTRLRVLFLTQYDQNGPSSRVRVYQFLPYFENLGLSTEVRPLLTGDVKKLISLLLESSNPWERVSSLVKIGKKLLKRYQDLFYARQFDIVVVQKDVLPAFQFTLLRVLHGCIIYEFDDAIWEPTPSDKMKSKLSELIFRYRQKLFHRAVFLSDGVVAENSYLAQKAFSLNPHVLTLSAPISTNKYTPSSQPRRPGSVRFGWLGSPQTDYLLKSLFPIFEKMHRKGVQFEVINIGGRPQHSTQFTLTNITWVESQEVSDLRSFDIGLMPLDDSDFNKGRLGYKMIVYASMGIPIIAQDVGLNKEVVRHGNNGFLVKNDEEWIEYLTQLASSESLRIELGKSGRKLAESKFSIDQAAQKLKSFFEQIFLQSWQDKLLLYHPSKRARVQALLQELAALPHHALALDIGTGTGAVAKIMHPFADQWNYIEKSPQLAKIGSQLLDSPVLLDFPEDMRFDLITCLETIPYVENWQEFLQKLNPHLNTQGHVVISFPNESRRLVVNKIRHWLGLLTKSRGFKVSPTLEALEDALPSNLKIVRTLNFSDCAPEIVNLALDGMQTLSQVLRPHHEEQLTSQRHTSPKALAVLRGLLALLGLKSILNPNTVSAGNKYKYLLILKKVN